jgi:catecholate siderophore receptor
MRVRSASLSVLLLASAAPVFAADSAVAVADTTRAEGDAPDIVVTGQRGQYGARSTTTATKTSTDIKNVPQAMTVISKAQIEDQDLRSIADVLTFVPGAMPGTGESNRDQMTLRGNSTTADFFVDGIRDDVQYFRDLYNLDRVEVLKGPNAMIFGRGGGGGVVNRVTKRASLGTERHFGISGDSHGGYRFTADVDQALSEGAGVRVNGMYENGESFRDHVDLKRYAINPTAGFMVGPDTRVDVSYEFLHDRRTTDRGVPAARTGTIADPATPIEGFDDTFFGDPDLSFAKADVHIGTFTVNHDFGGGLKLRSRTLYGDYDKFYQNVFPGAVNTTTGRVALSAYNAGNDRTNLFNQTDLIWEGGLGGMDHTFLAGFEVGRQKSRNTRATGTFLVGENSAPLSDPTVERVVTFAPSLTDANNRTKATVAALYVQEQLRPADWLEIVAGLRFDSFKLHVDDFRPAPRGGEFERRDELWSPRLGVILKPTDRLSIYGSVSRSYLPQSGDQFSGLEPTTETLKPERFDNVELGAKWEVLEGLLASVAVYRLDRSNTRAADPANPNLFILTGKQRSKGVEVGLERSVTARWQVSGGYAWQKARITERTTACNPETAPCEVPLVPRHQFSLWNRYNVNQQLGVGLGLVARSKAYASISNTVRLPSYARVDAAAYYKLTPKIQAQVNVENLFGRDYFSTAHNDNNIAPGAPRTIRATLRFGI